MLARKAPRESSSSAAPNSKVKEPLVPLSFDASLADSGIAAISISTELGEKLLKAAGKDLKELQTTLDKGEMMLGVSIPDADIQAEIDIDQQKATGRNVIGRIKAKDPEANQRPAVINRRPHRSFGQPAQSLIACSRKGTVRDPPWSG